MGGHTFTKHIGLNAILYQAGREAGYQTLMERAVLDFARWKIKPIGTRILEVRADVELFGHLVTVSRYLDGTIRHTASVSMVQRCSQIAGVAASDSEKTEWKKYPPSNGKAIVAYSMETRGSIGISLEALLRELSVLAFRRQLKREIHPTKWLNT